MQDDEFTQFEMVVLFASFIKRIGIRIFGYAIFAFQGISYRRMYKISEARGITMEEAQIVYADHIRAEVMRYVMMHPEIAAGIILLYLLYRYAPMFYKIAHSYKHMLWESRPIVRILTVSMTVASWSLQYIVTDPSIRNAAIEIIRYSP